MFEALTLRQSSSSVSDCAGGVAGSIFTSLKEPAAGEVCILGRGLQKADLPGRPSVISGESEGLKIENIV